VKPKKIYKKNPNFVERQIDTEFILMPILKSSDEINCLYTLNEPASKVWKMIDGKKTWDDIRDKLNKEFLENYDTSEKEIEKEFNIFLKDLKEIKAIK
jgi:hypothetical protein